MWKQEKKSLISQSTQKSLNQNAHSGQKLNQNGHTGQNPKRMIPSRSPGKRPFHPMRNQPIDSNGPDVRIRGTIHQIHEKYVSLARDATVNGDRILSENLLQHAEHYIRLIHELAPEEHHEVIQPSKQVMTQPIPIVEEETSILQNGSSQNL